MHNRFIHAWVLSTGCLHRDYLNHCTFNARCLLDKRGPSTLRSNHREWPHLSVRRVRHRLVPGRLVQRRVRQRRWHGLYNA